MSTALQRFRDKRVNRGIAGPVYTPSHNNYNQVRDERVFNSIGGERHNQLSDVGTSTSLNSSQVPRSRQRILEARHGMTSE